MTILLNFPYLTHQQYCLDKGGDYDEKMEEDYTEIIKLEKEIEGQHDNGLTGTLVMKYIKCGKPDCKCMQGYRHGPIRTYSITKTEY